MVKNEFEDKISKTLVKSTVVGEAEILVISDRVVVAEMMNNIMKVNTYDFEFKGGVGRKATINAFGYVFGIGLVFAGGIALGCITTEKIKYKNVYKYHR